MQFLDKRINDMSFRNKMIVIYYVCILIPIVSLSTFFCIFIVQKTQMQHSSDIKYSLDSTRHEIESFFNNGIMIADSLYANHNIIYRTLNDPGNDIIRLYENTNTIDTYINSLRVVSNCKSIIIYTDSNSVSDGINIMKITDNVKKSEWYVELTKNPTKSKFFYYKNSEDIEIISYYKALNNQKLHGNSFIKIDYELNKIADIIKRNELFDNIYIFNENDTLIYSYLSEGNTMDPNNNRLISTDLVYPPKWKLKTSNVTSVFTADLTNKLIIYITFFLAIILITSLFIFYISYKYKNRIDMLTYVVKQSEKQIFEQIDEKFIAKDEIGVLAKGMNVAFDKINYLFNEVYASKIRNVEIELESKNNELRALYNQINPHFLFNIMTTLCMKSLMKGEKETANVLKNLSKFYRNSLSWNDLLIPIEKEVGFLKEYLSIQEYRFNDTLEYSINLDDNSRQFNIPKMAIQIFVENSCVHGFAGKKGKKKLKIDICCTNDILKIIVTDNGCGIKPEILNEINEGKQVNADNHLGIYNIKQRLSYYYKDRNDIKIENLDTGGTKVTIEIRGDSCNVQSIGRG